MTANKQAKNLLRRLREIRKEFPGFGQGGGPGAAGRQAAFEAGAMAKQISEMHDAVVGPSIAEDRKL